MIVKSPDRFFDRAKSEKKLNSAFSFLITLSLVYFAATVTLIASGPLASLGIVGLASIAIFSWAMNILMVFVMSAVVFAAARLLGGKGDYNAAFKALVYGSLPSQALGWLPFIGLAFGIWSLYIQTKGVSRLYKLGTMRSFAAVISPSIIALVLILVFASALLQGVIPKIL